MSASDPSGAGWSADDPRVQAGLDHLQRAAHEMISASRALLDVMEELVDDPRAAAGIVDLLGTVSSKRLRPTRSADVDDDDGDDEPPVQRIPVS